MKPPVMPLQMTAINGAEVRIRFTGYSAIFNLSVFRLFVEIYSTSSGEIQFISAGELRQYATQINEIIMPQNTALKRIKWSSEVRGNI